MCFGNLHNTFLPNLEALSRGLCNLPVGEGRGCPCGVRGTPKVMTCL